MSRLDRLSLPMARTLRELANQNGRAPRRYIDWRSVAALIRRGLARTEGSDVVLTDEGAAYCEQRGWGRREEASS